MEILHDEAGGRLVCLNSAAETWDEYWKRAEIEKVFAHPPQHRFLCGITRKYVASHAKILEGGCGIGSTVYALNKAGFDAYGIDFAEETIALSRRHWPHLKISQGDVRSLPFPDNSFDGYWSLGVIEHFYQGYAEILAEMSRVLKPGGVLFLTFPAMNRLRKTQARKHRYLPFEETPERLERFWQFLLDPADVIRSVEAGGFRRLEQRGQYSLVGLKQDMPQFKKMAKWLIRLPFGGWVKANMLADMVLGNFSGHISLCIFEKRNA